MLGVLGRRAAVHERDHDADGREHRVDDERGGMPLGRLDAEATIAVLRPRPTAPPAIWHMYTMPPARLERDGSSAVTAAVVIDE